MTLINPTPCTATYLFQSGYISNMIIIKYSLDSLTDTHLFISFTELGDITFAIKLQTECSARTRISKNNWEKEYVQGKKNFSFSSPRLVSL